MLGPIEVRSAGVPIPVGGVKQRSILALLIVDAGHAVPTDRIVDEIYGDDATSGARRSVQTIVSAMRRDLGDVIVSSGGGYRFDAPRVMVDACRFEDDVSAGLDVLDTDPSHASSRLADALGLWRGDPYGDIEGRGVFEPEIARLTELRLSALEARVQADLACGRHRSVVAEVEAMVAEHPLRERLWALWMLALYRVGRQADALAAYQQLRTVLGEQLGLEPSTELRQLEDQILLQDPALDLAAVPSHNLPVSLTSFIGRELESIDLGERLTERRLVTLTGAGGSGKTRLAVEFGRQVLDEYPDGVWLIDLRGVEGEGVAPLIASTLGVIASGDSPIGTRLVDALSHRRMLLILDNCERVLDAVAPFVEQLIRQDGQVRVLATSREALGVPGESMLLVPSLPLPELAGLQELVESEAAVLFTERAGDVRQGFVVDEHVGSVFEICRTVDGLPLALELAAARLAAFSPEELAERLDDQLGTLKIPQRAGDLRHATIEATIQWSWDLLDSAERTLLGRLSVLHGAWLLDAAEAVCGFDPLAADQVADLLASLVAKSLVVIDSAVATSTRYRLLEPIRQYTARAIDEPDTRQLRNRVVDHWSPENENSYDPNTWFARRDFQRAKELEADQANLAAAVEWALESGGFEVAMLIFIGPYGDLLLLQGSASELTFPWMEAILAHRDEVSRGVLLCALSMVCSIASSDWRMEDCLRYAELAIEMSRTSEERRWFELFAAVAMNRSGQQNMAVAMFDRIIDESANPALQASALLAKSQFAAPRQAWILTEKAMDLAPIDSLGWWNEGRAAWLIGEVAAGVGRYDLAIEMEDRSIELSRLSGWSMGESTSAAVLCWLYVVTGRLDEAAVLADAVVPLVRRSAGFHSTIDAVLIRAADVARLQGDLSAARSYVAEVERIAARPNHPYADMVEASAIYEAALIARDDHDPEYAGRLLDGLATKGYGQASDPLSEVRIHLARASVDLTLGNPDSALENLTVVLDETEQLFHSDALEAVDLAAIALAQQGRAEPAARLEGAVDRERDDCSLVIYPPDALLRETSMGYAQSLIEDDWDIVAQQGRTMTMEQAIELAITETHMNEANTELSGPAGRTIS